MWLPAARRGFARQQGYPPRPASLNTRLYLFTWSFWSSSFDKYLPPLLPPWHLARSFPSTTIWDADCPAAFILTENILPNQTQHATRDTERHRLV